MSDASEVKRWSLSRLERLSSNSWENPTFVSSQDHERIVAELKAEIVRLELVAMAAAESIKEKYKIMDMQKRVIEKLKRYTQHRVECVYRTGVFQYSNDCDCGLKAIEKGEA